MIPDHAKPVVNVAGAVLLRSDGHVLLSRRPEGKLSAGCWEFPGGKFDAGENERQALAREVMEEVGVVVERAVPWMTYDHVYDDKIVRLHLYKVISWWGELSGREGQQVAWEDPMKLSVAPLLSAHERALQALCLSALVGVFDLGMGEQNKIFYDLRQALRCGLRLILLRAPAVGVGQFMQLARRVSCLAHAHSARVLVEGDVSLAVRAGADGVHVSSARLRRMQHPPSSFWWSASCRDEGDLQRAGALGAAFAMAPLASPCAKTGDGALGWDRFTAMVRGCPMPVFVAGDVSEGDLDMALSRGAHGVAIGPVLD